ncbi:hypothetical protein [Algibacter mikhailovii]|uniref:Uncharacterized protein n=1 Tax=Algibacter mikhailovii TaxID=425498 RepID=A0A918V5N8_9FLAO|nr:hypothetical protein [Algibacter mikhailovii]GGZ71355.1 hypothetical protein GCM10007028_05780 [Algibacter mikhailovii]
MQIGVLYVITTHFVEFLAAFTGLFFYSKFKPYPAKYFIWFLWYLSICDLLNVYVYFAHPDRFLHFLIGTGLEKNYWWTTVYWKIGAILFFSFYYYKILKTKRLKNGVKFAGISFFVYALVCIVFNWNDFFIKFFPSISVFGAAIIFLCTTFYFLEILNSPSILTFYKSINFYISAAIFIWWLIITPIVFFDIYLVYDIETLNQDLDFVFVRRLIYLSSNVIMYLTFTFALIWCRPEND